MTHGSNVKKLIIHKISLIMIPSGAGIIDAVDKFKALGDIARSATAWVEAAIHAVKSAPNNPYGDDDEAIAGEILRRLDAGKARDHRVQGGV